MNSKAIQRVIEAASKYIAVERLWINPDCGLKTRNWQQVTEQLGNMVAMTKVVRRKYAVYNSLCYCNQ